MSIKWYQFVKFSTYLWISFGLIAPSILAQTFNPDKPPDEIRPQDVVKFQPLEAMVDGKKNVLVRLQLETLNNFSIYKRNLSFSADGLNQVTNIDYPPSKNIIDPMSGDTVSVIENGLFKITISGAPFEVGHDVVLKATFVACTEVICLFPYTQTMTVNIAGRQKEAIAPVNKPEIDSKTSATTKQKIIEEEETLEDEWAKQLQSGSISFGWLLLILFLGGMISNLTPCVYPMIPITLRVLANQGNNPYQGAVAYALGIVITYTSLGVFAAASGGMFGQIMASSGFNLTFALIMIVLGITMLGFGNFSKMQMLGQKLGSGKPSFKNALLMGAGAGLVASPCTGPILAALLVYTAKNHTLLESSFLLFVFSAGFGTPYVFLGGAAAKVSQVRLPPQAQVAVKLFFAAVMFGLGFYYLRIPFYGVMKSLSPYWGMGASFLCGLGLVLTLVLIFHKRWAANKYAMLLPTFLLGAGFFSTSQFIAKPTVTQVTWIKNEAQAFATAKSSNKPILIDFWAEWCEACKKMDSTTFQDSRVVERLTEGWTLLKLDLTESTDENDAIQEKYKIASLPTLVLVPANGDITRMKQLQGYVSAAKLVNATKTFQE